MTIAYQTLFDHLQEQFEELKTSGLFKAERVITSKQQAQIALQNGKKVINLCANNYLGLANHPRLVETAKQTLDKYGFGMASVRFICGTLDIHKELEAKISAFLNTEDTILYSSCFDANTGLFETILTAEDAIISDSLNHASIIDGVRLCKAKRYRYNNNDMADLEAKLKQADTVGCRYKIIATDGVFSMDGVIANLPEICALAKKYNALTMVDDCHATGFIGKKGRGTTEFHNILGQIDIITSTFGKALGGASGGFTSGKKEVIQWLRQRSRPYLFSNTLAPVIAAVSLEVLKLLEESDELRAKLQENTRYFREKMSQAGFDLLPGSHPIIPVMIGDAKLASLMADKLLEEGIYVIAFSYPVVPHDKARIRTQMSAALDKQQLDYAVEKFIKIGTELGVIYHE